MSQFRTCSCSAACVTPGSCPCVFTGAALAFRVVCSQCNHECWGNYPYKWRAVKCLCPLCGHEGWVLPQHLNEEDRKTLRAGQ